MNPYEHQKTISDEALAILREHMIVYLAMQERTGKTLTAILIAEKSRAEKVLVVTTKKAMMGEREKPATAKEGWHGTLNKYKPKEEYVVINYDSVHKVPESFEPDLVIIDEAHKKIAGYPKQSTIFKKVAKHTKLKPIIYMSATPNAQSYAQLYHQFKLSSWTPWIKFSNFYNWFRHYGVENFIRVGGRLVKQYDEVDEFAWEEVKDLFIAYTRKELGFEHEPNDVLHYVELSEETKTIYRNLEKRGVITVNDEDIIADSPMSLRTKLHQIEGGTLKYEDESFNLDNTEKINYILNEWGDTDQLVIFYHYQQEKVKLEQYFKNAKILQATAFAEGVDLSMYDTCVAYSNDFSTAGYTQRRARQCNMKRDKPIDFHVVLAKNAISDQCYKTVAVNKVNFVDKYFERGLV